MGTIKALEGQTVHQIQSGQVIVDLCSVAKELVENSIDAGATSIEVRFKNHGLESIEVQDNGSGISSENYETIALKHYTSKLSSYDDLSSLTTFGFRGEALSSLCALSNFHIITARGAEAPKGTKLDFDISGKLKGTSVVASQRGTTIIIENLFSNLPVRRRELEKNIKREYGKVLATLQAYACISTQARISVSNVMSKNKKAVVFATKSNGTTRENIANVFGAKTLANILPMALTLEMEPASTALRSEASQDKQIRITGHVSRPVFGEGRQAPDRQMFFVNGRPCGLPQMAKVFNEVYKSFNVTQSPFIFANIVLDTRAYDVNVSPDKRTILLHEQAALLESLRRSLMALFERQDQTVPQSQPSITRLPSFKQPTISSGSSINTEKYTANLPSPPEDAESCARHDGSDTEASTNDDGGGVTPNPVEQFAARGTTERAQRPRMPSPADYGSNPLSKEKQKLVRKLGKEHHQPVEPDEYDSAVEATAFGEARTGPSKPAEDFNARLSELDQADTTQPGPDKIPMNQEEEQAKAMSPEPTSVPTSSIIQNAFDRMRPRRRSPEVATITIGSNIMTSVLGPSVYSQQRDKATATNASKSPSTPRCPLRQQFCSSMQAFAAPGSSLIKTTGPTRSRFRPSRARFEDLSGSERAAEGSDDSRRLEDAEAEVSEAPDTATPHGSDADFPDSDSDYTDEDEKKAAEEAKIAEMIKQVEAAATVPSEENRKRAQQVLKGAAARDSTTSLVQAIDASLERISVALDKLQSALHECEETSQDETTTALRSEEDVENDAAAPDRLALKITKTDFARLHIIGQFNLGFILAARNNTDLFIIDQHASDEKINFERLQAITVMQNQRLVHPRRLELTAVDEEIILENQDALLRNGFLVDVDGSGDYPVGQRVKLVSLPMSKETTFTPADLEELIALLSVSPNPSTAIPRPSKIRKLFAMRACRSSIMIGKEMTKKMMKKLVSRLGEIDKPWNCPHGRPTMRHVCGLRGLGQLAGEGEAEQRVDWAEYVASARRRSQERGEEDEETFEDEGPELGRLQAQ